LRITAEKRPQEGGWGGGGKKEGEGPRFFPADRTPDLFFRSLFGFGTVEFGIAGFIYSLLPIMKRYKTNAFVIL
jgi:hypothetical protein